jgi:hypothetical protein
MDEIRSVLRGLTAYLCLLIGHRPETVTAELHDADGSVVESLVLGVVCVRCWKWLRPRS